MTIMYLKRSNLIFYFLHESDYSIWSYRLIADAILKFCVEPLADLHELFRRMVFNILVYNNDDHPRNFGFLYDHAKKGWRLSPLYDVVPSVVNTGTRALALTIGDQGKLASLSNAKSAAAYFRLSAAEAQKLINEMNESILGWETHFLNCYVSSDEIKLLKNSINVKT